MTWRFSRFLPINFVSRKAGIAVTMNAIKTRLRGWVSTVRSPRSPRGKVRRNFRMRRQKNAVRARIAPSWMTMLYIFQKPFLRSIWNSASAIRRCAVELTGRNSVSPSMAPSRTERR